MNEYCCDLPMVQCQRDHVNVNAYCSPRTREQSEATSVHKDVFEGICRAKATWVQKMMHQSGVC